MWYKAIVGVVGARAFKNQWGLLNMEGFKSILWNLPFDI